MTTGSTTPPHMWLNGKLVPPSEARLDFLTPALHYGVAAFEGIRCYRTPRGPAIFRLQEHLERLLHSARVLGWRELPFGIEDLAEGCKSVVRASGFGRCERGHGEILFALSADPPPHSAEFEKITTESRE